MDLKIHEWRRLPEHERDQQLFFEDKAGDALLLRREFEGGNTSVAYRYYNGARPRQSQKEYWKRKSDEARRQARGNVPSFLKPAADAALQKDLSGGVRRVEAPGALNRYFHRRHAAAARNVSTVRTRFVPAEPAPHAGAAAAQPKVRKRRFDVMEIKDLFDTGEPEAKRQHGEKAFIPVPRDAGNDDDEQAAPPATPFAAEQITLESSLARRHAALLKQAQDTPHDVDLWLRFADFQDEFAVINRAGRKATSAAATRSCHEKRVEVLELALQHTLNRQTSVLLWCRLAEASAQLSDDHVEDVWDRALQAVVGAPRARIWLEFMNWMKTRNFAKFSVDTLRDLHRRALLDMVDTKHTLVEQAGHDDVAARHSLYTVEECLVRIVNSAAVLEQQAGYPERGLALFQIMIAMNALLPESHLQALASGRATEGDAPRSCSLAERVEFMDSLWADDRRPRLGETDTIAALWSSAEVPADSLCSSADAAATTTPTAAAPLREVTEGEVRSLVERVETRAVYEEWLRQELSAHASEWYPVRPVLEKRLADANPDRVVFLDDVEPYLVPVYEKGQHRLLFLLLLEYLAIPALFTQSSVNDPVFHTAVLSDPEGRNIAAVFSEPTVMDFAQRFSADPLSPGTEEGTSPCKLHALDVAGSLLSRFDWAPQAPQQMLTRSRLRFVTNVLHIAAEAFPGDPLFPILLVEVWGSADPAKAATTAKALLAKDKKNNFLWLKYASIVLSEGAAKARAARAGGSAGSAAMKVPLMTAAKIYSNLLAAGAKKAAGKSLSSDSDAVAFASLCRGYTEAVLLAGEMHSRAPATPGQRCAFSADRRDEALHILCCAAELSFTDYATARKAGTPAAAAPRIVVARQRLHTAIADCLALLRRHRDAGQPPGEQACLGATELIFCAALLDAFAQGAATAAASLAPRLDELVAVGGFSSPDGARRPAELQQQYLWVSLAKLGVHLMQLSVCSTQSFQPKAVGALLRRAAEALPLHPAVSAAHCEFEIIYSRAHNVRLYFAKALDATGHHPLVYLYATHVERRYLCNPTRAKRLFLNALSKASCNGAAALWLEMLRFESECFAGKAGRESVDAMQADLREALEAGARPAVRRALQKSVTKSEAVLSEVKGSFYRCIAGVPGCVAVWLAGLRLLSDAVSPLEVKEVVDLLHEKHLHVRVFVEEVALDAEGRSGVKAMQS